MSDIFDQDAEFGDKGAGPSIDEEEVMHDPEWQAEADRLRDESIEGA